MLILSGASDGENLGEILGLRKTHSLKMDIYHFNSFKEFLGGLLLKRKAKNPRYSIRCLSRDLGLASSTLADILTGKARVSTENALKIAKSLELNGLELKHCLAIAAHDSVKCSSPLKDWMTAQVKGTSLIHGESTSEILHHFNADLLQREIRYALPGEIVFRILKTYEYGQRTADKSSIIFSDTYVSSDQNIICTGYFLKNEDGTYRSYLDRGIPAAGVLESVDKRNQKLNVRFDKNKLPTVHNFILAFLHTDIKVQADLKFSEGCVQIHGNKIYSDGQKEPYFRKYQRLY